MPPPATDRSAASGPSESARPPKAFRALALLGAFFVAGCSGVSVEDGPVAKTQSRIAYGALDTTHTAVVAVLSPVGTTELQECSGSLVAVVGGDGYVLTAAHCCNAFVPTTVVASSDYSTGESFLSGGSPAAPVYRVAPGSVYYDSQYSGSGHDFCMLKFAGAAAGMATLALPTASGDGLQLGAQVEHVGFGFTDTSTTNSQRRSGVDAVDQQLTSLILQFSQGGPNDIPGTCDGDSGGPSLLPAGVAQGQQVVVGVQSSGGMASCAQETFGIASRVSSAIGAGQFITSYLGGAPVGVNAGASPRPVPAGARWAWLALATALVVAGSSIRGGLRARLS